MADEPTDAPEPEEPAPNPSRSEPTAAAAPARVRQRRRISRVWLIPIVAVLLGAWMVVTALRDRGPEISIVFPSAEGIEAGETKIRVLNVEVGVVEQVRLVGDLESVVVTARLDKDATRLLREDTQFWVVTARIGTRGISGLGTLLYGGYIELAPGTGRRGRRSFVGLAEPPVTPAGAPGLHLTLQSDRAGSIGTGDPILYKSYPVGRIESARFDPETQQMQYRAFIEAPYDELVTSVTRFWNTSGISLELSADGIQIDTGSLESMIFGGVAMGLPEGMKPGDPVTPGETFALYNDYASVLARPYRFSKEYVVRFGESVRGVRPGAPVEYRGIPVGHVERLLIEELAKEGLHGESTEIPLLIRLEPGRLELSDSERGLDRIAQVIENGVSNGLRATLETGNLITGSQYVAIDFHETAPEASMGRFAGRPTIPTSPSGLAGIQQQIVTLLEQLNELPLEGAVVEATDTLEALRTLVGSRDVQELPGSVEATLADLRAALSSVSAGSPLQQQLGTAVNELDQTLVSLRSLLETLESQPNALLFNRRLSADPRPPAGLGGP